MLRFELLSETSGQVEVMLPYQKAVKDRASFIPDRGIVLLIGARTKANRLIEQQLQSQQYTVLASGNATEAVFVAEFFANQISAVIADGDNLTAHNLDRVKRAFHDRNKHTKFICLNHCFEQCPPEWRPVGKSFEGSEFNSVLYSLLADTGGLRIATEPGDDYMEAPMAPLSRGQSA